MSKRVGAYKPAEGLSWLVCVIELVFYRLNIIGKRAADGIGVSRCHSLAVSRSRGMGS